MKKTIKQCNKDVVIEIADRINLDIDMIKAYQLGPSKKAFKCMMHEVKKVRK